MYVSELQIKNLKSFTDSGIIRLSRGVNVLIGQNNAGKSCILKALYRLQRPDLILASDVRQGSCPAEIRILFEELNIDPKIDSFASGGNLGSITLRIDTSGSPQNLTLVSQGSSHTFNQFESVQSKNFIYPYLSKRKVGTLDQGISLAMAISVSEHLGNINAKIDTLRDTQHPKHDDFVEACRDVLGFEVSTFAGGNGKQAGLITSDFERIPLEAMGEGTVNILGLIVQLCMAENQLFLVEELENDIHPKALKALLALVLKKSKNNQFVISTHSNIVAKYLGADPTTEIFSISMEIVDRLPLSTVARVGESPEVRRQVLEDLGYEFADFGMWKGYLFFEEASAESIVRDHLIRWFAPSLVGKLRTVSSGGASQVAPKFEDLNRLFMFTHLEPAYKNKAWVVADGDAAGKAVIEKLWEKFGSTWDSQHFRTWTVDDFEFFYPTVFKERVSAALGATDKKARRDGKKKLLDEVLKWIAEDDARAKLEFQESAREVIEFLNEIETKLS